MHSFKKKVESSSSIINFDKSIFKACDSMIASEPGRCLASETSSSSQTSSCSTSQSCATHIYERSCLTASIPFTSLLNPSTLPSFYTSLQCCFRCCFEFFLSLTKVGGDKIELTNMQRTRHGLNVEKPSYRSLSFGLASLLSISSYIVTDRLQAGNIPVFHITTLTTLDREQWVGIKGRRVMLLTHIPHCVPIQHVHGISSSMSHFNNPTVATWYTTQLPCELITSSNPLTSSHTHHSNSHTREQWQSDSTDVAISSTATMTSTSEYHSDSGGINTLGQSGALGPGALKKLIHKLHSHTPASPTLPFMNLLPMGKSH